jgi:hypothetical protein
MDHQRLMKEEKDRLLKKWEPFLQDIDDDYIVENTAILLENEAQYLTEAPQNGATGADDVAGLQKIMLPIVRRVFPNLIANNIVSVQPIAAPAGIIFYLKYQFGTERPGNEVQGQSYDYESTFPEYSMYEDVAGAQEGYNPYYSADEIGPFTASDDDADGSPIEAEINPPLKDGSTRMMQKWPMGGYQSHVHSGTPADVFGTIEITRGDSTQTLSFSNEGGSFVVRDSDRVGQPVTGWGISLDYTDAATAASVDVTPPATENGNEVKVSAFYKTNMEFSTNIPEMRITIGNIPVTVKTRKLKAMWSQESEQDLKAYHGLSADAELTALVSNEMIAEIDREIINKAMSIVPQTSRFTHQFNNAATTGNYLDQHLSLMQSVTRASNEVFRKSKIGPANWMIVGTKVASYIEVLKGFIPNPVTQTMGMNIVKAGTYAGRYDIYKDPMFPNDKVLMGHKSPQSPFGAGVVYSPYVTNLTPVIVGEDDFNPRRGFLARYGLTQVPHGQLLYAMIDIKNLP